MTKNILWAVVTGALAIAPGCGGEADVGGECEVSGAMEGECVDGAICGQLKDDSEAFQCLTICTDDAMCASTESCNGVSGSNIKGCRLK